MTDGRLAAAHGDDRLRAQALGALLLGLAAFVGVPAVGQDIEREPINYSAATPRNVVARLQERLDRRTEQLGFEPARGYLKSLLGALDVPQSSQVLVFSKTSMQRERIAPRTPRAIYFNDDVMVGFCLGGRVLEVSAADEAVGTAFYTLDQARAERPALVRQTDSCLLCHGTSSNQGMPGHLVRSLFVDGDGYPLLSSGSFRTDHTSPLAERWGGWYVTGTSGGQKHLGNMICEGPGKPEERENAAGVNVVDLKDQFRVASYLTPHSDIVALMVLEHQAGMLNRLAHAALETRMALYYEREMNKALGRPAGTHSDSARSRIRRVGDEVVAYMLFRDEARLTDRIEGTSTFAADFAGRGPRDPSGRSLRDLDLNTRLFRYPCSYLIHSRAFDGLPGEVKDHIYQRLWDLLNGRRTGNDDPDLAAADRQAILEILRATRPDLPAYWNAIAGESG
jgi:hypothetical protein